MTIKQAKIFRGDKCGEDNSLGYHALKSEIRELKKQYKFCDELVDELKVDGYKYLQGRICDIHDENKNMLGFDRGKAPTEEEIEDQIFAAGHDYIEYFVDNPTLSFHYDNERLEFVSDDGQYISSGDVLGSEECRELAMNDLWENYRHDHPRVADIDAELSTLHFQCESQIAHFRDRQAFIDKIKTHSNTIAPQYSLVDYITRDRDKVLQFIDNELRPCKATQGKLIAMLIIVLHDAGYLVEYNGKLSDIHKAFKDAYPGKVGALTGIVDYVNSYNNDKYTGDKQIKQEALESLRYKLK